MNEQATEIAQKHIQRANPSLWNGLNERPIDFDSRIITYPIDGDTELDISFEYEKEDGWLHLCELRCRHTGELLNIMHGYGIDSPQNLTDTIEDICEGRLADAAPASSQVENHATEQNAAHNTSNSGGQNYGA